MATAYIGNIEVQCDSQGWPLSYRDKDTSEDGSFTYNTGILTYMGNDKISRGEKLYFGSKLAELNADGTLKKLDGVAVTGYIRIDKEGENSG